MPALIASTALVLEAPDVAIASPWLLAGLAVAGVLAGVLNAIAGGGGFLTLPTNITTTM